MVAPVPTQISNLRPCPTRPSVPSPSPILFCRPFVFILLQIPFPATPLFSHPSKSPGGVKVPFDFCPISNVQPLTSVHARHLHHVASISLPFSAASAYFLSRRGYTLHRSQRQTFRPSNAATLLFTKARRLFCISKKVNSFAIKQIQPLFAKHRRWGCL